MSTFKTIKAGFWVYAERRLGELVRYQDWSNACLSSIFIRGLV